jgi:hypothetical protein
MTILDFDIRLAGSNRFGAIKHAKVTVSGLTTDARAIQLRAFKNYNDWCQFTSPLAQSDFSPVEAQSAQQQLHVLVGDVTSTDTFRASFYIDCTDESILPDTSLLCLLTCKMERYYEPDDPDIAGLVLQVAGDGEWRRVGTFQTRGAELRWFKGKHELLLI